MTHNYGPRAVARHMVQGAQRSFLAVGPVSQQASKPASQQASKPASQQASQPANCVYEISFNSSFLLVAAFIGHALTVPLPLAAHGLTPRHTFDGGGSMAGGKKCAQ
jgi:hypothetical protein